MKNEAKPIKIPSLRASVGHRSSASASTKVDKDRGDAPDENVALLLDHDKVHAALLVLAHE